MSGDLEVTVTGEDAAEARRDGSVTVLSGRLADGSRIRFAGDWRAVEGLLEAVEELGEVTAVVPSWAVLGVPR